MAGPKGREWQVGGAVKIQDVARLAGVSPMTVSRAFNCPERLSPEALKKVMGAVEQTGYVPNLAASSLRSARTRLVVVLVPSLAVHYIEVINSLTDAFAAKGLQVMLGQIGHEPSREAAMLRTLLGRRPDGIVIMGLVQAPESRKLLAASGIPVVETFDLAPEPIDMLVGFSHDEISFEVCRYFAAGGRKRLALMSGCDPRAVRRRNAFLKAAESLGLSPPAVHLSDAMPTHGRARTALAELLDEDPGIDALWCTSDMLAMGVLTEARMRGISIPDRLAVIGSGDLEFARTIVPTLTTIRLDGHKMGMVAAQAIIDRAEGREVADRIVDIGFSLIPRESA